MSTLKRIIITIGGTVQGLGFRPFVYRLATSLNLKGWINNNGRGVTIEVEGNEKDVTHFLNALKIERPLHAYYENFDYEYQEPVGYDHFEILDSSTNGSKSVMMLPDIATCPKCLEEIFDPDNRRYLYPFTNCTHCGPRYSIIKGLPYDREQTTMSDFTMCEHCQEEYENPKDRRFHAQPNACPDCGPQMELWDKNGNVIARRHQAMGQVAEITRSGEIVALKGIGGFQLIAEATNEMAIQRLRKLKNREEKPFALMVTSLEQARKLCTISDDEKNLLCSPQAPIVILKRKTEQEIPVASSVAPDNPNLGIMLPYSPIHHILMRLIGAPIVATSGNISDEPICIDEHEALKRLGGIADFYLVHNRSIERHVDDSVVRMVSGKPMILRRARGYAPLPISIKSIENSDTSKTQLPTILALGGHLKSTIAINKGTNLFISQYIGDLDTFEATKAYHKVTEDLPNMYDLSPDLIVHDKHPEYYTSKDAQKRPEPSYSVQHHYAHILSCMAEHNLNGPLLGVAWDGTGYGTDETIWGGEFMLCNREKWMRLATFRPFRLPGGDKAMREPRRSALGLLFELFGDQTFLKKEIPSVNAFRQQELKIIRQMLDQKINAPLTSSVGRIFDAVSSLLNLRQQITYEGQAAIALEHYLPQPKTDERYSYRLNIVKDHWVIDWGPMIRRMLLDLFSLDHRLISNKFHNTLSEIIVDIAMRTAEKTVVLSGGCFQNVYLIERTINELKKHGFNPYWHQQIPTNDGGISAGQLYYGLCNADKLMPKSAHYEVSG